MQVVWQEINEFSVLFFIAMGPAMYISVLVTFEEEINVQIIVLRTWINFNLFWNVEEK